MKTETKENWKFQLSPKISETSKFWKLQQKFQMSSILEDSSYSAQEKNNYPKTTRETLLLSRGVDEICKQYITTFLNYQTNC